jgi:hypothetical protein
MTEMVSEVLFFFQSVSSNFVFDRRGTFEDFFFIVVIGKGVSYSLL